MTAVERLQPIQNIIAYGNADKGNEGNRRRLKQEEQTMITAMATPPPRESREMVMNSSSWCTVVVSVAAIAESLEQQPMGAP